MERLRSLYHSMKALAKPAFLNELAGSMGNWLYILLFAIIFAETGLVVAPFLPGDSMLFAVGSLAAFPNSPINLPITAVLLIVAAILGDAMNYSIGYRLGPKVFSREDSKLLNKKHLLEAQKFYDKYGGKAIIIARFVPIVRTFAPFVAGIGRMNYARFALFNIAGGVFWILTFLLLGWYCGQFELIKDNPELVAVGIVLISVLPIIFEFVRARMDRKKAHPEPTGVSD